MIIPQPFLSEVEGNQKGQKPFRGEHNRVLRRGDRLPVDWLWRDSIIILGFTLSQESYKYSHYSCSSRSSFSLPYFYSIIFPYSIVPGSIYTYHYYLHRPGQISPLLIAFLPTLSATFSFDSFFYYIHLFSTFRFSQLSFYSLSIRSSNHPNGCPSFYLVARPAHPLTAAFRHAFSSPWLAHHRRELSPARQCGGQSIFVHCPECPGAQARMPKTVLEIHW